MENKEKGYCSTFVEAREKVMDVLEGYAPKQINLHSETARMELAGDIMHSVAQINQQIFAQYIETVKFQSEVNEEAQVNSGKFEEQRRMVLSDALWLEETGGFTGLSDEAKQEHRKAVREACARDIGLKEKEEETNE